MTRRPEPGGDADRVEETSVARARAGRTRAAARRPGDEAVAEVASRRSRAAKAAAGRQSQTVERRRTARPPTSPPRPPAPRSARAPRRGAGAPARTRRAGPDAPMSSVARRDGRAERMRMTAPSVPTPNGTGMKYGSVVSTRAAPRVGRSGPSRGRRGSRRATRRRGGRGARGRLPHEPKSCRTATPAAAGEKRKPAQTVVATVARKSATLAAGKRARGRGRTRTSSIAREPSGAAPAGAAARRVRAARPSPPPPRIRRAGRGELLRRHLAQAVRVHGQEEELPLGRPVRSHRDARRSRP